MWHRVFQASYFDVRSQVNRIEGRSRTGSGLPQGILIVVTRDGIAKTRDEIAVVRFQFADGQIG